VVEFISAEHTPRNLLIRAVKLPPSAKASAGAQSLASRQSQARQLLLEYEEMKLFWGGVTPHLEVLLEGELRELRQQMELTRGEVE
jgi:hypothetical protein